MKTQLTKTKHRSRRLRRFAKANEAVSALEYAILVGVIAVGIGVALLAFEDQLSDAIAGIGTEVAKVKATGAGTLNAKTN